jgi:PAS domain S-box-containing protein
VTRTESKSIERSSPADPVASTLTPALDHLPVAILIVDGEGRIESANVQAELLLGYDRGALAGVSVDSLVPTGLRDTHAANREAYMRLSTQRPMGAGRELYAQHREGRRIPVEIGLNPLQTSGGTRVLAAIVDISERKAREERVQQALAEKELLLGEVHHRVKNNLQIVHSLLDLGALRTQDPALQSALVQSRDRVRSMSLIHQTLYQSRDFASVDFELFLDGLVGGLLASYTPDGNLIELQVATGGISLPIVSAIPCGLIVNELVTNALKHGFANGRRGSLKIELRREGDLLRLSVENDGVPPPLDVDLFGGTTMGLQLVALLAKQLKGKIELHREPATRFVLSFPALEAQ